MLRPAGRSSLTLWCIYNDLRITTAVSVEAVETPAGTEAPPPLAFCGLLRESDASARLDLRGDFAAVCVDAARRELTARTAKKNLAVPLARVCDVFFVDQRERSGLAICVSVFPRVKRSTSPTRAAAPSFC